MALRVLRLMLLSSVSSQVPEKELFIRKIGIGYGYRYAVSPRGRGAGVEQLVEVLDQVATRKADMPHTAAWALDPDRSEDLHLELGHDLSGASAGPLDQSSF